MTAHRALTLAQLEAVATLAHIGHHQAKGGGNGALARWCATHGMSLGSGELQRDGATRYRLSTGCPFDPSHTNAAIFERPDGDRGFKCFHKSCSGYTWRDVQARFETSGGGHDGNGDRAKGADGFEEPSAATWPRIDPAAFHGLAGDFVRAVDRYTEADRVGVLATWLVWFGLAIGRFAHCQAGGTEHYGNLFVMLVGVTAGGRKGTASTVARKAFEAADSDLRKLVRSGMTSGEGVIWHVRDPILERDKGKGINSGEMVMTDEGALDNRLLCYEPEFTAALRKMKGEANSLSQVLRQGWDGEPLGALTTGRVKPSVTATGAQVAIVGHATPAELVRTWTEQDTEGGLGNRFLWFCVRRSKYLPRSPKVPDAVLFPLVDRLRDAIAHGASRGVVDMTEDAWALWEDRYPDLSRPRSGMLAAMTSRATAQVRRLAMLYTLLDGATRTDVEHLLAALAVVKYSEDSAAFIWGAATGDPIADRIEAALVDARAQGLTRTDIRDLFGKNRSKSEIDKALASLEGLGRVSSVREPGRGRPTTRYHFTTYDKNDNSPTPAPSVVNVVGRNAENLPDTAVEVEDMEVFE